MSLNTNLLSSYDRQLALFTVVFGLYMYSDDFFLFYSATVVQYACTKNLCILERGWLHFRLKVRSRERPRDGRPVGAQLRSAQG